MDAALNRTRHRANILCAARIVVFLLGLALQPLLVLLGMHSVLAIVVALVLVLPLLVVIGRLDATPGERTPARAAARRVSGPSARPSTGRPSADPALPRRR